MGTLLAQIPPPSPARIISHVMPLLVNKAFMADRLLVMYTNPTTIARPGCVFSARRRRKKAHPRWEVYFLLLIEEKCCLYHHLPVSLLLGKRGLPPKFALFSCCPINISILFNHLCVGNLHFNKIQHKTFSLYLVAKSISQLSSAKRDTSPLFHFCPFLILLPLLLTFCLEIKKNHKCLKSVTKTKHKCMHLSNIKICIHV